MIVGPRLAYYSPMLRRIFALNSFLLVVHLCLWMVAAVLFYIKIEAAELSRPLAIPGGVTTVSIDRGSSFTRIAGQMEERGWIDSASFLVAYCRVLGIVNLMRAGEYSVESGSTVRGLIEKMIRGDVINYQVTLVEGRTFRDFRAALESAHEMQATLKGLDDSAVMTALGLTGEHPEGRFYPDTYFYHRHETDLSVLKRALTRMDTVLETEWQKRSDGLPYRTAREALIMASIVEKETGAPEERPAIAGVFTRRLKLGMKLQTDPTVIYGMGASYAGNITRRDLQTPTPWNTYVIQGLPPTPIANPGIAAIRAALHPEPGKSLYFVARGDGTHQFSASLDEHQRAVNQFQKKRRSGYHSAPAP